LTISSVVGLLTLAGCGGSDTATPEVSVNETTLVSKSTDMVSLDDLTADLHETAATSADSSASEVNKPKLLSESQHIQRFDNGQIKRRFEARTYSNKEIVFHGRYVEYYPNGQRFKQGMYVDGKQDGMWGYWHDNGRIAKKGQFIDGEHDGIWIYKTDKGHMRRQESYKNGLKDGLWIVYGRLPGTKVREENWKQDLRHGLTTEYNPETGQIMMTTEWVDGKKQGKEQVWYEDGSKAIYREYQDGELHGRAVVWAPSGSVRTDLRYVNGVRQSK
jgi:antitoxin component YwqK of YwqJK toxin-antitoxin module